MTDREIVDVLNGVITTQELLVAGWNKTVVEIKPGKPQIDYHKESDQWVPNADVLRCIIDDAGPDGEATIHIDNTELSLEEFGRLLRVHAGWGMRIAFVPEERVTENPKVEIREPKAESMKRLSWIISMGLDAHHPAAIFEPGHGKGSSRPFAASLDRGGNSLGSAQNRTFVIVATIETNERQPPG